MSSSITQTQLEEVRRNAICILENRLYFYATKHRLRPQSAGLKVVNFDREFVYEGFNNDFGPLNIAQITEYCRIMENQLQRLKRTNAKKKQLMGVDPSDSEEELDMRLPDSGVPGRGVILVHHASNQPKTLANQIVLMGAFMIANLGFRPHEVAKKFLLHENRIIPFRDSGTRENNFEIRPLDCFNAIELALQHGWWNWQTMDIEQYNYFSKVEEGDLNWILPGKLLAMSSPSTYDTDGGIQPARYLKYFKRNRVATVVRLNSRLYSHSEFEDQGVKVYDLEYADGTNPSDEIIVQFIRLVEREISQGKAVAVHCRAGLGRTGTLIALYMMYKHNAELRRTIAWIRLCRPGSIVGEQQQYLERMQGAHIDELFRRQTTYASKEGVKSPLRTRNSKRIVETFGDDEVLPDDMREMMVERKDALALHDSLRSNVESDRMLRQRRHMMHMEEQDRYLGVGAGLGGTRVSLKPTVRELNSETDENASSGLSNFLPSTTNRALRFGEQSTMPFTVKDTNRDYYTQVHEGAKMVALDVTPRKFGLAGKMIQDEKHPHHFIEKRMSMTEDMIERDFCEKRGVIDRLIYEQVANPVPPPQVTEVFMMHGPPAQMERLQARVDEAPPVRERIEAQMASEVARQTSPLRQRNKGAFKELDEKHQDPNYPAPTKSSDAQSTRTRKSTTSEVKKRPLKSQVQVTVKNPAQHKRVSQLLDFSRADRIDAIDDDSYIKQYYKQNYGGKTVKKIIDNRTDTTVAPYHANEFLTRASKSAARQKLMAIGGYLGKAPVKSFQEPQYSGVKQAAEDCYQGQLLKERKRQYQSAKKMTAAPKWKFENDSDDGNYDKYAKELHPDTKFTNSSYVTKAPGYTLQDKFKRVLHSNTLAAVRKFDLDRDHQSNKKCYNERKRPYGHGPECSSSDDEDYQYRGKQYQKKELISPVKERDHLKSFYGKARDNLIHKSLAKNWMGKVLLDDEWSDDDIKPHKRKQDNETFLKKIGSRPVMSAKTPEQGARKWTALEKKIMEKLESANK